MTKLTPSLAQSNLWGNIFQWLFNNQSWVGPNNASYIVQLKFLVITNHYSPPSRCDFSFLLSEKDKNAKTSISFPELNVLVSCSIQSARNTDCEILSTFKVLILSFTPI